MPKQKLFDEDSDGEVKLETENEYAKKYDKWREKEELHKLEQKYGSKSLNDDGSASSDSEDESDEPPEISEEMETQFLKTLALLKTKDPRIYDPDFKFFNEKAETQKEEKPKTKSLTFDDSDDDEDDNDGNIFKIEKKAPELGKAVKDNSASNKPKEVKIKEFLTGKVEHIEAEAENDLAPLKALWSDPKLNEGEAFLRDYILNKRYLEENEAGTAEDRLRDDEDLEADEQRVEEQGHFERAYNFRFEEPDQEYLKRFPRTMNYIRPKDDRRSRKRAEVRARKEEEKTRKMEEIARLKALKLKEIQEKIARIKEVTGNDQLAFQEEDIEGDFDPEEHDRRMKALFDDQYYGEVDDHKPVFPDLDEELEIENWEKYELEMNNKQMQGEEGLHCEDEDFNMDADFEPKQARANLLEELKENMQGKKRRNRKKKSKLASLLEAEKPAFVPTEAKTYAAHMEEYYAMDCEDVIGGDLPTRFKYRQVLPNDYGLTVEEILLADDKELTQWVPLKKLVKHRPADVEKGEVKTYAIKAADVNLKKKILPSLFKELPEEPEIVVPMDASKTKKKKKKKHTKKEVDTEVDKAKAEDNLADKEADNPEVINVEVSKKSKKKKKHKSESEIDLENNTSNNTNNINKIDEAGESVKNNENQDNLLIEKSDVKKKKKKHKSESENNIDNNLIRDEDTKMVGTNQVQDISKEEEINVIKNKKKRKQKIVSEIAYNDDSTQKFNTSEEHGQSHTKNAVINKDKKFALSNKSKEKKKGVFIVEDINMESPSPSLSNNGKINLKRKLNESDDVKMQPIVKKKKKKNYNSQNNVPKKEFKKFIKNSKEDTSVKMSDERLKAYGLNPKKYKKFMKFKKF